MIYATGDCPVGCDGAGGLGLLFVTPRTGAARVLVYCPECECLYEHPTAAREGAYVRDPKDYGLTDEALRPASAEEIAAAGFSTFVAGAHGVYFWPRSRPSTSE